LSLKSDAERHIAQLQLRSIKHLIGRGMGQKLRIWSIPEGDHRSVYGSVSGTSSKSYIEIVGIVTGNDFFASDSLRSSDFKEGWLWTDYQNQLQTGMEVEVINPNSQASRKYTIVSIDSLGWTQEIFYRYLLASEDRT